MSDGNDILPQLFEHARSILLDGIFSSLGSRSIKTGNLPTSMHIFMFHLFCLPPLHYRSSSLSSSVDFFELMPQFFVLIEFCVHNSVCRRIFGGFLGNLFLSGDEGTSFSYCLTIMALSSEATVSDYKKTPSLSPAYYLLHVVSHPSETLQ